MNLNLRRREKCVTSYYTSHASSSSASIDVMFRMQRNSRYGRFAYDDDMSSDEDERYQSSSASSVSKQKVRYFGE